MGHYASEMGYDPYTELSEKRRKQLLDEIKALPAHEVDIMWHLLGHRHTLRDMAHLMRKLVK